MKNKAFLLLILLILGSCAHKKADQVALPPVTSAELEKKSPDLGDSRAVFHIVAPLNIELILTNMETKKVETFLMDKTLSQIGIKPGHWQVSGFILNGQRYELLNAGKRFVFRTKKKKITYAGSYIFQCPKVNQSHLKDMKKMSFFNRYPFRTQSNLCEMVVGSDYKNVNRVWMELNKPKYGKLTLGF